MLLVPLSLQPPPPVSPPLLLELELLLAPLEPASEPPLLLELLLVVPPSLPPLLDVPASEVVALPHLPPVQTPAVHWVPSVHAAPSAFFAVQSLVPASQYCVALQSVALVQVVEHAPVPTSQIGPAWVAPAQSVFEVHLPHEPSFFT